jgi:hypothetical protein
LAGGDKIFQLTDCKSLFSFQHGNKSAREQNGALFPQELARPAHRKRAVKSRSTPTAGRQWFVALALLNDQRYCAPRADFRGLGIQLLRPQTGARSRPPRSISCAPFGAKKEGCRA